MSGTIDFQVGQTHQLTVGGKQITITVVEIDVPNRDIVFNVTGDGVERPNEPRRMEIFALAAWIGAIKDKE